MAKGPELLLPLLGLYPFNVQKGHGSFVTFSLTSTPLTPTEEHFFWISMCHWQIKDGESQLAHSESPDEKMQKALALLNNRRLNEILFNSWVTQEGLYNDAILFFEDDIVMTLMQYRNVKGNEEIFLTRDRTGRWVSYFANGSILETEEGQVK